MTDTPADKPKLALEVIPVTPFQQNTSLLWSTRTMEGVFVDPGGEVDKLMGRAEHHGVTIKEVWLTHGHLDHAGGATHVSERTGCPIIGPHEDDQWLLDSIVEQWAKYGVTETANCQPDKYLQDGDTVELDGEVFDVIHCPGHTPGHVVLHYRAGGLAFVGDVLFKGSIAGTMRRAHSAMNAKPMALSRMPCCKQRNRAPSRNRPIQRNQSRPWTAPCSPHQ